MWFWYLVSRLSESDSFGPQIYSIIVTPYQCFLMSIYLLFQSIANSLVLKFDYFIIQRMLIHSVIFSFICACRPRIFMCFATQEEGPRLRHISGYIFFFKLHFWCESPNAHVDDLHTLVPSLVPEYIDHMWVPCGDLVSELLAHATGVTRWLRIFHFNFILIPWFALLDSSVSSTICSLLL